jgi:hypothetical protein
MRRASFDRDALFQLFEPVQQWISAVSPPVSVRRWAEPAEDCCNEAPAVGVMSYWRVTSAAASSQNPAHSEGRTRYADLTIPL